MSLVFRIVMFACYALFGWLGALPLSTAQAEPEVLILVGIPGEATYQAEFGRWADQWQAAAERGNCPWYRIDQPKKDQKQQLLDKLAELEGTGEDPLWVILIGHGTFDGESAKVNLHGPDISATEINTALQRFERPVLVVNCTSASAPFINKLSGPNRIIVTSTRSGFELNYSRFGKYMSQAIADPTSDLDKDGQTSLLEAFLRAAAGVAEFYKQEGRLASEHALIDDNGDKRGTPADWFRGVRPTAKASQGGLVLQLEK